jgi:hypothetical protein
VTTQPPIPPGEGVYLTKATSTEFLKRGCARVIAATVAPIAPGQGVYLARPWRGYTKRQVGQFVRVAFVKAGIRLTHDFPRDRVMTSEEFTAAREQRFAAERAAQATRVRFITLWQPWASLMALGLKVNETRSWSTTFRGHLGIHAGAKIPAEARELVQEEPFRRVFAEHGLTLEALPRGAVVATVRVYDCVPTPAAAEGWKGSPDELAFGNYEPGRHAWLTHECRQLPKPIPVKGAMGLWECDWLPVAVNVGFGADVLPVTDTARQAYYRRVGEPRSLEGAS